MKLVTATTDSTESELTRSVAEEYNDQKKRTARRYSQRQHDRKQAMDSELRIRPVKREAADSDRLTALRRVTRMSDLLDLELDTDIEE